MSGITGAANTAFASIGKTSKKFDEMISKLPPEEQELAKFNKELGDQNKLVEIFAKAAEAHAKNATRLLSMNT